MLADRLDGTPCQVFIGDAKLHVQAADSVYYPDVCAVWGSGIATGERVAHDAVLVVEVLSDSTVATDRRAAGSVHGHGPRVVPGRSVAEVVAVLLP